jgi:hypothetical protein
MKTSLIIDDRVYEEAKKEAAATGKTLSEIVSLWSALGRDVWKKQQRKTSHFKPISMGEQKIDLSSRKEWMEDLEDDRT